MEGASKTSQFEDPEEEEIKAEEVIRSLHLEDSFQEEPKPKMNPDAKPFTFAPSLSIAIQEKVVSLPQLSPSTFPTEPSPTLACIVCATESKDQRLILEHMLKQHSLVIGDLEKIADLSKYLKFWQEKMKGNKLEDFATTINTQLTPRAPVKEYFLLSDIHPDDHALRAALQQERLDSIIKVQQEERYAPDFKRKCLFCKIRFDDRKPYFRHMFEVHGFNIGLPDNLVNVNTLLDMLEVKITDNICIYCEKLFRDYSTLKLHMRKKKHFKISSRNKDYDKFYIINYLEEGKNWEELLTESDDDMSTEEGEQETWDDWLEEDPSETLCLFCDKVLPSAAETLGHAKESHGFDLEKLKKEWSLDFYARIRLVNYIRLQVRNKSCPYCATKFSSSQELEKHMEAEKHFGVKKDSPLFQDIAYLKPTIENDPLLLNLEDDDDFDEGQVVLVK